MTVDLAQLITQRPDVVEAFYKANGLSPWGKDLQGFANTWDKNYGEKEGYKGLVPPPAPPPPPTPYADASGNPFDARWYVEHNPDVNEAVASGKQTAQGHYSTFGMKEGRAGSGLDTDITGSGFDEQKYLAANPDVAKAVAAGTFGSGRAHYLSYGSKEGRSPYGAAATTPISPGPATTTTSTGAKLLAPQEQENQDETAAAVARGKQRNQMFGSFLTGGGSSGNQNTSPFGGSYMTQNTRSSRLMQPSAYGGGFSSQRGLW